MLENDVLVIFNQPVEGGGGQGSSIARREQWVSHQEVRLQKSDPKLVSVLTLGNEDRVAEVQVDINAPIGERRKVGHQVALGLFVGVVDELDVHNLFEFLLERFPRLQGQLLALL